MFVSFFNLKPENRFVCIPQGTAIHYICRKHRYIIQIIKLFPMNFEQITTLF